MLVKRTTARAGRRCVIERKRERTKSGLSIVMGCCEIAKCGKDGENLFCPCFECDGEKGRLGIESRIECTCMLLRI